MTKGREIIIFAKSQPIFDVHRQYRDVSLLDSQARVSRFRCRIFHCFVDISKSSSIVIGFYLQKAFGT